MRKLPSHVHQGCGVNDSLLWTVLCGHAGMKLAPFKETLTGKSVGSAGVVPTPPIPRICAICGVQDEVTVSASQTDFAGRQFIEHSVTTDLRYIKRREDVTRYFERKGWRYKFHLGRHAMERMLCRGCLNEVSFLQRDFDRKKAADSARPSDTYYGDICEDQ